MSNVQIYVISHVCPAGWRYCIAKTLAWDIARKLFIQFWIHISSIRMIYVISSVWLDSHLAWALAGAPSHGISLSTILSPILVLLPPGIFHLSFFSPISFSQHICNSLAESVHSVFIGLSPIFHFFTSLLFATSLFSLQSTRDLWHIAG